MISRTSTRHYKSAPEICLRSQRNWAGSHPGRQRAENRDAVRVNVQLIKQLMIPSLGDTVDRN